MGLYQAPGSVEPDEGWGWVSGEPVTFVGWGGSDPNNQAPAEDFGALEPDGQWNDWDHRKYDYHPIHGIVETPYEWFEYDGHR